MKRTILLAMPLFLLFFSCSQQKKEGQTTKKIIADEIREVFKDYVNQVNSKAIGDVGSYFSGDERFYWVEDGVMQYSDKTTLLNALESFYPTLKTIDFRTSKVDVEVLDSKTAMLYVEYVEDVLITSGYAFTLDGAMTILTVRENDTWKFLMGHSSIKKPREDS